MAKKSSVEKNNRRQKMAKNALKYPADKARDSAKKYSEL